MKEGKIMQYSKFDIVDYLDSDEAVAALGDIARARGVAKLARDTGLNRESLSKTLRPGAMPRFDTVFRIMKALNINMQLSAR